MLIVDKIVVMCLYGYHMLNCPKATCQQYFAHNFLCKKHKDKKFGAGFRHLFFPYFST